MASTTILARIRSTVVDIKLAVLTLKTLSALTLIRANEIFAGCAILTWRSFAFIDFLLTVRADVTLEAVTTMTIAYVFTGAIVAKILLWHAFSDGSVLARDHFYIAYLAGPSGRAVAVILILFLHTCCLIFAWIVGAPVNILVTSLTLVAVRTMTCVILYVIMTSSAVQTGRTITLVDTILTIGSCVARSADTCIIVDAIDTCATIHATTFSTILIVCLTIDAGKAKLTLACIRIDIFLTNGSILTGMRLTFVDIVLTVFSIETIHA